MSKQRCLIGIILLTGCNFSQKYNNDNIDSRTKETIFQHNEQVVAGLKNNDPEKILALCSSKLVAYGKNDMYSLLQQKKGLLDSLEYEPGTMFLIRNSSTETMSSVTSGSASEHDYKITFMSATKQSIVSIGTLSDSIRTVVLTCIYGKYDDGWKLNIMRVGDLRRLGMDALDWYEMAKEDFDKGHLADAGVKYTVCAQLMRPAAPEWQYQKVEEIRGFGDKLKLQLNKTYTFPINQQVNNASVSIFYLNPEIVKEGYFPCVSYVSSILLSDTLKLSKECDSLNAIIGDIFLGFEDNRAIVFRAFNKIPTATSNEPYFSMIKWKR